MTIVGEAWLLVRAKSEQFAQDLEAQTSPGFQSLRGNAEKAGEDAGGLLGQGVGQGARGIEKDLEATGERGGKNLGEGMSKSLSGITGTLGQLLGSVGVPMDQFKGKTEQLTGQVDKLSQSNGGLLSAISAIPTPYVVAGAAIVAVGAISVDMAAKYQQSTDKIAAAEGITTGAAKKVGDAFLTTAGTTTFSASAIAAAFAGVAGQARDVNNGALSGKQSLELMRASMDATEASGGNLNSITATMTKTLQAFGLGINESPMVSDVLYNAANRTGVSVDTMGAAIDKAKAKMGSAAPSIQEMGGFLVDLTKHGETGRSAMTILGSAFTGIVSPSAAVAKAQEALGVSFLDSQGHMKPLTDVIETAKRSIAGMGDAQAVATLKSEGFGSSSDKMLSTIRSGGTALDAFTKSTDKVGSAQHAASTATSGLKDSMEKAKSGIMDGVTALGEKLLPIVTKVAQAIGSFIAYVVAHWPEISEAFKIAWAIVSPIVEGMINTIKGIIKVIQGIIDFVKGIFTGNWGEAWKGIKEIFSGIIDGIKAIVQNLFGALIALFKMIWDGIKGGVISAWNGILSFFSSLPGTIVSFFASLPGKIASFFSNIWDKIWAAFKTVDIWLVLHVMLPVMRFFLSIPEKIAGLAAKFWDTAWAALKAIGQWIYSNIELPVINWFLSLPSKVASAVSGFWDKAWAALKQVALWIYTNIELPVINWFKALPGKVKSAVTGFWDKAWAELTKIALWIYTNIELPVINWFKALPGKVKNAVTGFWDTAWADLKQIALWIYTNIELPVINWFKALPGKVKDAVTSFWDKAFADLKQIAAWFYFNVELPAINWVKALPGKVSSAVSGFWDTAFADLTKIGDWLETNVWQPVLNFFKQLPSRIGNAVGNLLGDIPGVGGALKAIGLATGGYVTKPTLAVVGESGPEFVIPEAILKAGYAGGVQPLNATMTNTSIGTTIGSGIPTAASAQGPGQTVSIVLQPGAVVISGLDPHAASAASSSVSDGLAAVGRALHGGVSPVRGVHT